MREWCEPDCTHRDALYELVAAVFHSGSSASSGHYVCYARTPESRVGAWGAARGAGGAEWADALQPWVLFDDASTQLLSDAEMQALLSRTVSLSSSTAYILFYSLRQPHEISVQT